MSDEVFSPDKLFAGNADIVTDQITIASGQNLVRGTVIGLTLTAGAAVATAANTGKGAISGVSLGIGAKPGNYVLRCTAASAGAGTFAVINPDGQQVGSATVGTPFVGEMNFSIADGDPDFIVGDTFVIPVTVGKGKIANSMNTDGSNLPHGILTADCDATGGDRTAGVFLAGEFNEDALTFGGTDTADTYRATLRKRGIFIKKVLAY